MRKLVFVALSLSLVALAGAGSAAAHSLKPAKVKRILAGGAALDEYPNAVGPPPTIRVGSCSRVPKRHNHTMSCKALAYFTFEGADGPYQPPATPFGEGTGANLDGAVVNASGVVYFAAPDNPRKNQIRVQSLAYGKYAWGFAYYGDEFYPSADDVLSEAEGFLSR